MKCVRSNFFQVCYFALFLLINAELFLSFSYLKMATQSLYIFNLLPLPFLDGTQLLDAVLDVVLASGPYSDAIDLEALEGGRGRGGRLRGRHVHDRLMYWIGKIVRAATLGLCTGCVGLGVINLIVGG